MRRALSPEEQQRRRFQRWSAVKAGIPFGVVMAIVHTWRESRDALWTPGFFAVLCLYLIFSLPIGLLFGWFWGSQMWRYGFGRRLPGDVDTPRQ